MHASYGVATITAAEKCTIWTPKDWYRGKDRPIIFCHPLAGTGLSGGDALGAPGLHKLIRGLARRLMVIVTDLGGSSTFGNNASRDDITTIKAYAEGTLGCPAGRARLVTNSMGNLAALRWILNGGAGDIVSVLGAFDTDDVRNFNRPAGWAGTVPNTPNNVDAVNTGWGLAAGSTGDYPTHGTSLVALPAGANPYPAANAIAAPYSHLAYYSSDDTTALPATTQAHVAALGTRGTAVSLGALGHTDTATGAAPPDDIIDWLLAH